MEPAALDYFPSDYFSARERFLARAREHQAELAHYPIGARGPNGESLSIDTAYLGAAEPRRLLIVSCATHGVEGFAGSALQQHWLDRFAPGRLPSEAGCLLVHAVNPYGFAWCRRANENNVDLNRNALARFPGPPNPAYRRLERWLNPPAAGTLDFFYVQGAALLLRHGFSALQQAIVEGQYEYPRGLFYGGTELQESLRILFDIASAARWRTVERVIAIDIHTGVGRAGTYKLMVDYAETSAPYGRMVRWFGADGVASNRPAGSIAYRVSGGVSERLALLLPAQAAYTAVLEFGTVSPTRLLATLRRENRIFHYDRARHARERGVMREVFCPRGPAWRRQLLAQGENVLRQAERACFSREIDTDADAPPRAE